jgi:hypothetical protein
LTALLQLNAQQAQRLHDLKRQRDIASLSQALARCFPDVASRLADRYALLMQHGLQRATARGLTHALCAARYLACWFALGAEFENKPAYAWARDILDAPARPQGVKVFQLCRRTGEELAALAQRPHPVAGAMPVTTFTEALRALDAELMDAGVIGALVPGARVQLGEPCDLDAVDVRLAEPWGLQQYVLESNQWRRLPVTAAPQGVTVTAQDGMHPAAASAPAQGDGVPAAGLPPLHLLSTSTGGALATLRIRTKAEHCCDVNVHPLVTLDGPTGRREWRGRLASDIQVGMPAAAAPPPTGEGLQPVIGAETPALYSLLSLNGCGLRSAGRPLGTLQSTVAVLPSEQHLMAWHREPGAPVCIPDTSPGHATRGCSVRLERDGVALEATRWRLGLEDLDAQMQRALSRLATAWERESGVTEGRLEAQPQLLSGDAAVTWGWSQGREGVTSPPFLRVAGSVDLVACALNLRLSGHLLLHGSRSRLRLHLGACERLQASWDRRAGDTDLPSVLAAASTSFRQPLVLAVEVLAGEELAVADVVAPVTGALVGSCGLKPRPDGLGLQWFAKIALEAVGVVLSVHDPLLGQREVVRPLLPAMTLIDWSLG